MDVAHLDDNKGRIITSLKKNNLCMRRRGQQTVDHIKILLCHVYDSVRDMSIKKFVKIESFVDSKLNYERKKVSCVPGIVPGTHRTPKGA